MQYLFDTIYKLPIVPRVTATETKPEAFRLLLDTEQGEEDQRAQEACERALRERLQRLAKSPPVQPVPIFDLVI